jgi:hypothetical protein
VAIMIAGDDVDSNVRPCINPLSKLPEKITAQLGSSMKEVSQYDEPLCLMSLEQSCDA